MESKAYDICLHFKTEKQHLILAGFYPTIHRKKLLTKLFSIFIVFYEVLQLVLLLAFVFANTSDLKKLSETLLYAMTQLAFLSKLFNFIIKRKKCLQIEAMLNNELFMDVNDEEKKIFRENISRVHTVAKIYRVICVACVLLYGVFPFIDSSKEEKSYTLPCLFPFNPDNYHTAVNLGEVLSVGIGAWLNSTIDIFFCVLVTTGERQFEILGRKITNVTETDDKKSDLVRQRLVICIKYYHDLLKFIDMVEDTFSGGIFVQFMCSVGVICLTGFQMLLIEIGRTQFYLLITYFSCMINQVFMYCWYGHFIMEKSKNLTRACYEVDWPETNIQVQKMLVIIMERAKKPIVMSGGGFFNLNLDTFVAILRSSYSYFAVLQGLYSKN